MNTSGSESGGVNAHYILSSVVTHEQRNKVGSEGDYTTVTVFIRVDYYLDKQSLA